MIRAVTSWLSRNFRFSILELHPDVGGAGLLVDDRIDVRDARLEDLARGRVGSQVDPLPGMHAGEVLFVDVEQAPRSGRDPRS